MTDKVSVHDFHATVLHLMGFDHEKLSYPSQGVNQRLSNITKTGTKVVKGIIA
jgi:ssRNA-specific RNase YbeY (16S rRNA maturation enzyme)